jgi:hypothetical protein
MYVDEATTVLAAGYARLRDNAHPDPYIIPYMPGGSLFMRNSPPPLAGIFPDGIPDDVDQYVVYLSNSMKYVAIIITIIMNNILCYNLLL